MQWNDTESPCDTDRCIHWLFEEQVAASPNALAVDDGRQLLTYAQLNEAANRIAHYLSSVSIGRGSLVGVCMDRSTDLIAAVLGILKCGAAYVPIEPAWPDQRIAYIVETLDLAAILFDLSMVERTGLLNLEKRKSLKVAFIQNGLTGTRKLDGMMWSAGLQTSNPPRIADADDRAYVIFTSGSSGDPKAVVVRHRSVINLIDWVNHTYKVDSNDKILFTTSIAFDLSVYDIFGFLAAGGMIRSATTAELRDPQRLANLLYLEGITFWDSAPAAMERLCPFLKESSALNALRLVFLSGDWIPLALPPQIRKAFPACRLVGLGGATEATVWSNFHEIHSIDTDWNSIPYGRPIQNVRYYILNSELEPCPIGIAGELYIGGQCVSGGYENDPELTARKFISSPFVRGDRLYRTGDRAKYGMDGTLELIGRTDRQIKIRGVRIEPAEIEAVLQRHPKVQRAFVLTDAQSSGSKRLIACIVPTDGVESDTIVAELKATVRRMLPAQMIPARFVVVPELPITLNGKIDSAALLHSLHFEKELSEDDLARSETERLLAKVWCRILHLPQVGIRESFFDLGGDSLQIVAMMTAAAGIGLHFTLPQLHDHPTIRQLAQLSENRFEHFHTTDTYDDVPLTPTQRWFFERSLKWPGRYNEVFAFELTHPLDAGSLRQALLALQAHHDALRLRFEFIDGQWTQRCDPSAEAEVIEWDMASLSERDRRDELTRRVAALRREMALQQGTLIKMILVNLGPQRPAQLLLILHHLIFDAVSLCVIVEDFGNAITQITRGHPVRLPAACAFATWAQRLNAHSKSLEIPLELNYWLGLHWHRVKALPKDYPDGRNIYGTARTLSAQLSEIETSQLKRDVAARRGVSIGSVLLAMCVQTLSRWANHDTLLIDLTSHGRREKFEDASVARTVGYFTSNIPIVITLPPTTALHAVRMVHQHLNQMPQQGSGFGILRYLAPVNELISQLRALPHAELKFNYVGSILGDAFSSDVLRTVPCRFPGVLDPEDHRAYLHNAELSLEDGKLQIEWKYSAAVHRTRTIETLLENYLAALRQLIKASGEDDHLMGGSR